MSWFDLQLGDGSNSAIGHAGANDFLGRWPLSLSLSDLSMTTYIAGVGVFILVTIVALLVCRRLIGKKSMHWWVLGVISFIVFVYLSYAIFLIWNVRLVDAPDWIRRGEFGDSFGTLNALFSGLAFSGALLTLMFQRKDIVATQEQIRNQAFESQFYSLLNHQQEIVKSFDLQDPETKVITSQGRDCFKKWDQFMRYRYWLYTEEPFRKSEAYILAYNEVYIEHGADWELYFRSLYVLFNVIEKSDHPMEKDFAAVVRSLISSFELKLMFYHCLTSQGEQFRYYVHRYSLFTCLDVSMIYDEEHLKMFSRESYGENQAIINKIV